MNNASNDDFLRFASSRLRSAGIEPIPERVDPGEETSFGDSAAIFRFDGLLLRLVRDRGQIFADLASVKIPDRFYQLDDVDVTVGLTALANVLAREEPEQIDSVLARIATNHEVYAAALQPASAERTAKTIEEIERQRAAFLTSKDSTKD